jgi:dinuclear metal center YbgI/SA1388 family protein
MPTVTDLLTHFNQHFPLARAESWDNVGLQIGDVNAPVAKVLLAHEVNDAVLEDAAGFDALVIYHPLIFRPLPNLNFASHTARLAARCIALNINVIALHTAMDNADPPHALGDKLARQLDLHQIKVLSPSGRESLEKIVVFVPPESLEKVQNALWQAGAGHIGNYDRTSFSTRGVGTFRPLEGSDPYSGKLGELENADEWRLEIIVPAHLCDAAVTAMIDAHPYEEVAYDIYPLNRAGQNYGAARMGELPHEMHLDELVRQVQQQLNPPGMRIVRAAKGTFRKIACVPGSGASFIKDAARAGCDCLITGDIKHHDALEARALGLSIIDVTHAATETAAVEMMKSTFEGMAGIDISVFDKNTNPFVAVN